MNFNDFVLLRHSEGNDGEGGDRWQEIAVIRPTVLQDIEDQNIEGQDIEGQDIEGNGDRPPTAPIGYHPIVLMQFPHQNRPLYYNS